MGLGNDFRSCLATEITGCQPASGFSPASRISCDVLPAQADWGCFSTGAPWQAVPSALASWPASEMSLVPVLAASWGEIRPERGWWHVGPKVYSGSVRSSAVSLAWVDPQRSPPVSLGTVLSWGMGVVKTSTGRLSLPPALPTGWREKTPPNNSTHVHILYHPLNSSVATRHPLLNKESPGRHWPRPTHGGWRTVGAQQTPAHIWEASFGESVGSTMVKSWTFAAGVRADNQGATEGAGSV